MVGQHRLIESGGVLFLLFPVFSLFAIMDKSGLQALCWQTRESLP